MKLEIEQQIKELQDIKTEEADNEINLYLKEVTELQQLIKRLSIDTGTVVLPYIK